MDIDKLNRKRHRYGQTSPTSSDDDSEIPTNQSNTDRNGDRDGDENRYHSIKHSNIFRMIRYRIDRHHVAISNYYTVMVEPIKIVAKSRQTQNRCGIILYQHCHRDIYFTMGVDTKYGTYTDFGGGVGNSDRRAIIGGLREFSEESLGVFEPWPQSILNQGLAVYDSEMMILLINLPHNIGEINQKFKTRLLEIKQPEVKEIVQLSKEQLIEYLDQKNYTYVYHRVVNLLNKARIHYGDFMLKLP